MEHRHLDNLERLIDTTLAAEDVVLDGLRKACDKGWYTQKEIDERFAEYHEQCFGEIPALDLPNL